ncbi:Transcriptional regulator, AcrR family [hydrothermal vent metagenome]|uniref:Transcriptional regulator, AcrR family n=1 Tax=hydrothermal vent metagenome TaxID=652676 RepID=A0A3B0RIX0_9ZZZZ
MTARKSEKTSTITTRKTPQQQRAILLVKSILQAAAHILETGTEPFTTNHIAKRAGVSIGSLYQYFQNADAIMAALIEQHVADEREAAEAILATSHDGQNQMMRELLLAFVDAHANAPRLTARLHELAPVFGLHKTLADARDAQASTIAQTMGLPEANILLSIMAVEGVVLAMLASNPAMLKSDSFIDQLYAIAQAPLETQS